MLALYAVSGLPLSVNLELEQLNYSQEEVNCEQCLQVPLASMGPVLLNKSLRYPEVVYTHHVQMHKTEELSLMPTTFTYDVLFLPSGLLGIEFIKTHIFHMNSAFAPVSCVIHVFEGVLTITLQKNKDKNDVFDINVHVAESWVLDVKAGEKVVIPSGYYYTFSNCLESPVVFARVVSTEHQVDYQTLRNQNGLAYYLISKNAKREVVHNPRYKDVPGIKEIDLAALNTKFGYTPDADKPLYEEVKVHKAKYADLLSV